MKCLKKLDNLSKSGAGASKTPTCQCFEQLHFLKDSVSNRPTTSNVSLPLDTTVEYQADNTTSERENDLPGDNSPPPSPPVTTSKTFSDKRKLPVQHESMPKRKKAQEEKKLSERRDSIDLLLVNALAQCDNTQGPVRVTESEDSDWLFLRSLVPILQNLSPRQNRLARMDIQRILMDYEFND